MPWHQHMAFFRWIHRWLVDYPHKEPVIWKVICFEPLWLVCFVCYFWASYQIRKIAGCACAGNAGNVSPPPLVSDPDMHHGTCMTHVPWCMPDRLLAVSFEVGGGENVPGIPGACATHNYTYMARGPWWFVCQKKITRAWKSNCTPQNVFVMQLLIHNPDTLNFYEKKNRTNAKFSFCHERTRRVQNVRTFVPINFQVSNHISNDLTSVRCLTISHRWRRSLAYHCASKGHCVNTFRPKQNGCHFADYTFELIFLNEKCPIHDMPWLLQMMARRRTDLGELTHWPSGACMRQ